MALDMQQLEAAFAELPLYTYFTVAPEQLEFSQRIRHICRTDCPMYNKSWACPPAVGEVDSCRERCLGYEHCLVIGTVTEVSDIANMEETLATRKDHEAVTNQVRELFRLQGTEPYILSTESCAECQRCAWLDGEPCRAPERMHPCVESHGINIIPILEENGIPFLYGENVVTWISLLFWSETP